MSSEGKQDMKSKVERVGTDTVVSWDEAFGFVNLKAQFLLAEKPGTT